MTRLCLRTGLVWGRCYIRAKIKLPLSVSESAPQDFQIEDRDFILSPAIKYTFTKLT